MNTNLDRLTAEIADDMVDQLIRLELDTGTDPCSGLMVTVYTVVTDLPLVCIYDDSDSGFYDAMQVLILLRSLKPGDLSLHPDSTKNVWGALAQFEV